MSAPSNPFRAVTGRHAVLAGLLLVALCAGGAIAGAVAPGQPHPPATPTGGGTSAPPTSIAPGLPGTGLPSFMDARRLNGRQAPGFSLTDQDGAQVSLSQLRGKAVVLTFLDPATCGWLCPAVPEELRRAARDLGTYDRKVAFIAISVDATRDAVSALAAYSAAEGLSTIPGWAFVTGPASDLQQIWREYGIAVDTGPGAAMSYTGAIYFITPNGREAYMAAPYADQTGEGSTLPHQTIAAWGGGIARLAERAGNAGR